MNSPSNTSGPDSPGRSGRVDLQLTINVYVTKPVRGYSDVTLTDAGNNDCVLHQGHIQAADTDARKRFLDEAVGKCPRLAGLRDRIDLQISQKKLEWDKGVSCPATKDAGGAGGAKFWREGNSIVWANNGKPRPLCNFYAEIVNDVVVTDGVEDLRYYEVRVDTDGRPSQTRLISANDFDCLEWIASIGSWYTLAGDVPRCSKLVAEAIKDFNLTHGEKTQYTHTGWIKQDGKMRFLSASGALGADGLDDSLKTAVLDGTDHLSYYKLVAPVAGAERTGAVQGTLQLLELSKDRSKIWPLLGTLYATPVLEIDYSLYCFGRTGAFKTSTQRLFMAHAGVDWCERPLPSFKNATAFGVQLLQFRAKDVVLLLDDYQRPSTRAGTERMNNLAQNVFQNQADRGGRVKGNADGTQHSVKPSRCSLMASGEDVVPGLSTTARLLAISFQEGDIDKTVLTECQRAAAEGRYVRAYSGFLAWIAASYDRLRQEAASRQLAYRKDFTVDGQHGRTAENLAQALVGIWLYLDWCKAASAINDAEYKRLWDDALASLKAIGAEQKTEQDRQDPVSVFLESILEALASGRCHVTQLDGAMPEASPNRLGWIKNENGEYSRWDARGPCIGYLDGGGNLCLMLKTALVVLQKDSPAGETLTIGHVELGKQLGKADKVVKDGAGNNTRPMKVAGASVRLTCIKAEALQAILSASG